MSQHREPAVAGMVDLPDGRRIWIPPSGRAYWVGGANAGPNLTAAELERHGLGQPPKEILMGKATKTSGTREWSARSVNCCDGCSHGCLYCYGREAAIRRGLAPEAWTTEAIRPKAVNKGYRRYPGVVMFPTVHDITPGNLGGCVTVLGKLLSLGNQVLIVSKPHPMCIGWICREFRRWSQQILFRFTIGSLSPGVAEFWEPGAPSIEDRLACLCAAFAKGFRTSVSCEPLLEPERIAGLVYTVEPMVTETIWIGKANRLRQRTAWCRDLPLGKVHQDPPHTPEPLPPEHLEEEICRIEAGQTDERVREIYELLKGNPRIRWKESYRDVLGLPAEAPT